MKPERRQQKADHAEATEQHGGEPRLRYRIVKPLAKSLNTLGC